MAKPNKRQAAHRHGIRAEWLASLYLMLKGYRIVQRRYKTPVGEIDLIARKGHVLAMIEVKARPDLPEALEAVTLKSQNRIARAAEHFLTFNRSYDRDWTIRFDVVVVLSRPKQLWPFSIRHLDNAWSVTP